MDEQVHQLADFAIIRGRLGTESGDLSRQLEELESQIGNVNRLKQTLQSQVEESKHQADDEARVRHLWELINHKWIERKNKIHKYRNGKA